MKAQEDNEPFDEINITPMLDLAYVLLIIFIIMTTASVQGIKVNLPQASKTPALGKPKTKAITVTADGKIYLDTYPVTFAELETRMRAYSAETPDLPVIIKGDAKVQYEKIIDVMDLLGRLNITHLGLVTQKAAQ